MPIWKLLFVILSMTFISCKQQINRGVPLYDVSFDDVRASALSEHRPFCIVLIDSTENMSKEYESFLMDEYKYLMNSSIYNFIDIHSPENDWYLKWLTPASRPLTCVFSYEGELIDLIPGATKESFLYTKEALKSLTTTDFHWPNLFEKNKKSLIPLLNLMLKQKEYLNHGIYNPVELNSLIDSLKYPYPVYLKLLGQLISDDTVGSKKTAESLLLFESPFSMTIYKNEFITAKKTIDKLFDVSNEPTIRVNKSNIKLSDCNIGKMIPIEVVVSNDGYMPLQISKIYLSCSCLEQDASNDNVIIKARDSSILKFYFTPDIEGEISRDIYITSNAINIHILQINILATINKTNN